MLFFFFLLSFYVLYHCIVPLTKQSLQDYECSCNTKFLIVIMIYTNFLKLLSLPMSSIMCMQNIVESSSKPDTYIFLLKSTSLACLPHCCKAECHGTPQSGAWIYFQKTSLCLLEELPRNYNFTCSMGRQLFRAQDFSCTPLPRYWQQGSLL